MHRLLFCFLLIFSAGSCSFFGDNSKAKVKRAGYLWELSGYSYQDENIQNLNLEKTYVHFADIGWNEIYGAHPNAKNYQAGKNPYGRSITNEVPVIYITNEVFLKMGENEPSDLAYKVMKLLGQRYENYTELQIDCDWTESSRDRYFLFLNELKSTLKETTLSATLRLHQYKYREKSGIPPVDFVMLMLYHTSTTTVISEMNSIFDKKEAEKYIDGMDDYPIPLHAAIPYFSWIKWSRGGDFKRLFRAEEIPLLHSNGIIQDRGNNVFEILRDTVISNSFLRMGDQLLLEKVSWEQTREASELAAEVINTDSSYIALFDINSIRQADDFLNEINMIYHEMEQ